MMHYTGEKVKLGNRSRWGLITFYNPQAGYIQVGKYMPAEHRKTKLGKLL